MTKYYKENFYDEYAIKKDTIIAIVDSGSNANKICDELNALQKENEQLKQDIRELQNDKLLTELQMKCNKKQEHVVVLENKIRRMREAIHKLEWLSNHRNADLIRENGRLKRELESFKPIIFESDGKPITLYEKGDVE